MDEKEDIHYIRNVNDLSSIFENPNDEYELVSDIDAGETREWNNGKGFEPIRAFGGTLKGNGYTIKDLFINRPDESVGLFKNNNGTIRDLTLENLLIVGKNNVGAIAGESKHESKYENVNVKEASIYGKSGFIGGLSGLIKNSEVKNCEIKNCFLKCSIRNDSAVGGLIGYCTNGEIYDSNVHGGKIVVNSDKSGTVGGGLIGLYEGYYLGDTKVKNMEFIIRDQSLKYGGLIGKDISHHRDDNNQTNTGSSHILNKKCVSVWKPKHSKVLQYFSKN